MRVAIIGGRLQGVEACYLALALGWNVVLVDREDSVPARGLGIPFRQIDLGRDDAGFREVTCGVDLIIPALEDVSALKYLMVQAKAIRVPLSYDAKSYFISRSKKRSNRLLSRLGIPIPRPWPECSFPVIAKPSTASGSQGVKKMHSSREMRDFFGAAGIPAGWIVQEFLNGPSYSLEVFGCQGRYKTGQITELEVDDRFDCNRVLAPAGISSSLSEQMEELTLKIANGLGLEGIMDVEVIDDDGVLKVLEIDARLPSQTPSVVLHSTGLNMLEILKQIYTRKELPDLARKECGVVYEHIRVEGGKVEFRGEYMMSTAGALKKIDGFYGADVALTNYSDIHSPWVATLIVTGRNRHQAWRKRCQIIERIKVSSGGT